MERRLIFIGLECFWGKKTEKKDALRKNYRGDNSSSAKMLEIYNISRSLAEVMPANQDSTWVESDEN